MAVSITPLELIPALDTNWAEKARENDRRTNTNDANLKAAVEDLQGKVPVQRVKVGSTTYQPDANGLVTLPSGVVLPATTTAERDAIASPTLGQGIYNTTTGQPELYTPTGWKPFQGQVKIEVFTASATWTKAANARLVRAIAIGAGGGAGAMKYNQYAGGSSPLAAGGGGGGGRDDVWLDATTLPATVPVTVGAGGTGGTTTTSSTSAGAAGSAGGASSFGTYSQAGGGGGGSWSSSEQYGNAAATAGAPRSSGALRTVFSFNSNEYSGIVLAGTPGLGASSVTFVIAGSTLGPNSPDAGAAGGSAMQYQTSGTVQYTATQAGAGRAPSLGSSPAGLGGNALSSAQSANLVGSQGASRSGSGYGGDGGQSIGGYAGDTRPYSMVGGNGGLPGGGGGAVGRADSGTSSQTKGGDGARGEVLVITFF